MREYEKQGAKAFGATLITALVIMGGYAVYINDLPNFLTAVAAVTAFLGGVGFISWFWLKVFGV